MALSGYKVRNFDDFHVGLSRREEWQYTQKIRTELAQAGHKPVMVYG
jgi:hypothetical protein